MGVSAVAVARWDGITWVQLPRLSEFGDVAGAGVSVAVDSHDTIFVAWSDYQGGSRYINIRKWNNADWEAAIPILDAVAGSGTNAVAPKIRFDRSDRLVVSWIENGDIFFARWSGSAWERPWENLGLSDAMANDLALDPEGNPIVAWRIRASDQGVSVRNGTWTTTALPYSSQPPTVALDLAQSPMTAVLSNAAISVLRVANRQSISVADPIETYANDKNPRLMIDAQGNPGVIWLQFTSMPCLRFARWTGYPRNVWNERAGYFDDGTRSLDESTAPQVVADSTGTAWFAWRESGLVHVRMTNH